MTEPKPADQYGPSEHDIQAGLIEWATIQGKTVPELNLLFAIPNGGDRHPAVAAKMKAEGVKAGVPDLFLPVPRYWPETRETTFGLFLEMKTEKGRVQPAQREWLDVLREQGYQTRVARGFDEAKQIIEDYLGI